MRDFEDYCWRDILTPEMCRIYSAYHRPRAVASRPAIVVVHPHGGFVASVQPDWHVAARHLVEAAHEAGLAVIHSVPPDQPLRPEVPCQEGELVCARPVESAFLFSGLEALLTRSGSNGLVLCGLPASGPVRATSVDAKSFGYQVAIAEDATADEARLLHRIALFDVAHKYADVMTSQEIIAALPGGRA